jgi:hypothetical protein
MSDLAREILILLGMVAGTVIAHMLGLTGLTQTTRLHIEHLRTPWLSLDRLLVPLGMVAGLFLLHAMEVLAYAATFQAVRATDSWEAALYLSAGAYSTAGWTGLDVPRAWRVLASFEGLNGMLLVGWSTAFLFQTLHRILQSEDSHPLPEGAIATDADEAVAEGMDSPRPSRSGNGAP